MKRMEANTYKNTTVKRQNVYNKHHTLLLRKYNYMIIK